MSKRPYSQACENNKDPILAVLQQHCQNPGRLLEIGAGTGQHAAWLSGQLPQLIWQPSDVAANLPGIRLWLANATSRALPPIPLDVSEDWPDAIFDYLFTANTFHIMAREQVRQCIEQGCKRLGEQGLFLVYGPFNYQGNYTSDSNRQFDQLLKDRDARMGIRDQEWVVELFAAQDRQLVADHAMPANNRVLVFG